jgi:iron complex outermembrane receptor protein
MTRRTEPSLARLALAACAAAGMAGTGVVFGQPAAAAPDALSLEELLEVRVVTASRYSQRAREAPSAVTVITAEDLRTWGHRSLADAIATVPGLYVTNDRAYSYLGARGFNRVGDYNTRYLLLVDGNRMADNVYDQAYVGREFPVDVDLIERIEVAAGPGSSVYGGGAFFGVVNVITKSGAAIDGTNVAASLGTYGERQGRLTWGTRHESGLDVVASMSGLRAGGDHPYYAAFDTTNDGRPPRDAYQERIGQGFFKASRDGWTAQLVHGGRRKNAAALYPTGDFTSAGYYNEDRLTSASLAREAALGKTTTWTARAFLGRYDYVGNYPSVPPLASTNRDTSIGHWWGAEARFVTALTPRQRLSGGVDYQRDTRLAQRNFDVDPAASYLDDDRQATRLGAFVQGDFTIAEGTTLVAGGRLDRHSVFGAAASPRLALIHALGSQTTLKLLYGRAFRPPTAYEAYYGSPALQLQQNPGLRAERITNGEAVVERAWSRALTSRVSLFRYRISGLIGQVDDGSGNGLVYQNAADAHARGVEVAGTWQPGGGTRVLASWSWHEARSEGERPSNSPYQLAKLNVADTAFGDRVRPALEAQWISPRLDYDGNVVQSLVVVNANVVLPRLARRTFVSLGMYNVLDRKTPVPVSDINSPTTVPSVGRTLRLKVETTF